MTENKRLAESVPAPEEAKRLRLDYYSEHCVVNLNVDVKEPNKKNPPTPVTTLVTPLPEEYCGTTIAAGLVYFRETNVLHRPNPDSADFVPEHIVRRFVNIPAELWEAVAGPKQNLSLEEAKEKIATHFGLESFPPVAYTKGNELVMRLHPTMKVSGADFPANFPKYMEGLHPHLLSLITEGKVDVYVMPEKGHYNTRGEGWFEYVEKQAWRVFEAYNGERQKKLSCDEGPFKPADTTDTWVRIFTGRQAHGEPVKKSFVLGLIPAKYKRDAGGIARDENGVPIENTRIGWLYFVPINYIILAYSAFITSRLNGDFDWFIRRRKFILDELREQEAIDIEREREKIRQSRPVHQRKKRDDGPKSAPVAETPDNPGSQASLGDLTGGELAALRDKLPPGPIENSQTVSAPVDQLPEVPSLKAPPTDPPIDDKTTNIVDDEPVKMDQDFGPIPDAIDTQSGLPDS